MTAAVIGIDPGFTGAVALLGDRIEVFDTPVLVVGDRRKHDYSGMARIFRGLPVDAHVFIENVHSMPGSSGRSMFVFGEGFGAWQGIATALGYAITRVEPARWKGAMMDGMGKDKDAARIRAMMLFPAYANLFARKQDDGRAEALLIAEYGRRTL